VKKESVIGVERNCFGWASGGKNFDASLFSCKGIVYEVWRVGLFFSE
jgi:hypothetical protein